MKVDFPYDYCAYAFQDQFEQKSCNLLVVALEKAFFPIINGYMVPNNLLQKLDQECNYPHQQR